MRIGIVGGGISGLYAGSILKELGHEVMIFEASDRLGGRIHTHTIKGKKKFVELGAAEIHGRNALNYEMLSHLGHRLEPINGNEYLWLDQKLKDLDKKEELPENIHSLFTYFANIQREEFDGNITRSLKNLGMYDLSIRSILDGITSEYSASPDKIHASSLGEEEWRWTSGHRNFFSYGKYADAIDFFEEKLKDSITLNAPIMDVNYSDDGVILLSRDGKKNQFDKVILTTSLGVLKKEKINFTPSLPDTHLEAIQKLGFGKGRKLFIRFDKIFWEPETSEIIGGKKCPLYLIRPAQPKTICAYVMADAAKDFNQMLDEEVAEILLHELDEMFPDVNVMMHYKDHYGKDWTSDPYFCGTYSYSKKDSLKYRKQLKQPIQDKVFFIGEALNDNGHASTVHGAMETAEELARLYFNDK
ncbi:FAD-dependent oxidoreductase [Flammeovirga sp. MY04]|uniref:flavin monoamine oxidase family protein n=1 Tax=Flammeovirga sp. MY04 TaxID=1191459 RepID=UPI00080626C8|nr:NAD(P)/FAD-dependent oxidoreductase [Flammeovirga sp. MY04]ANQ51236.1 FAD-dependent oxidoreductase [Flammeovirga sp. MY04]